MKVKNPGYFEKSTRNLKKIIAYVYSKVLEYPSNTYKEKTLVAKDFLSSVLNIL